jgi:hypothetical protein
VKYEQMKKNVGCWVQLVPSACRLDEQGRKLPSIDDDWIIFRVSEEGVEIQNTRTGHTPTLGYDHIHNFTSNPNHSQPAGVRYGFLTLNVQLFLHRNKVVIRPNARPGEPVEPPSVSVTEKWVDFRYPFDSGLQARLEAAGYRIAWCLEANLARKVDLEDWEIVVEPDAQGVLTKFRLKDRPSDQTLIKKRNG